MDVGIGAILSAISILLMISALPAWLYSRGWDCRPSSRIVQLGILFLLLVFAGRI